MKKIAIIMLSLLMCLVLCGCGEVRTEVMISQTGDFNGDGYEDLLEVRRITEGFKSREETLVLWGDESGVLDKNISSSSLWDRAMSVEEVMEEAALNEQARAQLEELQETEG